MATLTPPGLAGSREDRKKGGSTGICAMIANAASSGRLEIYLIEAVPVPRMSLSPWIPMVAQNL